MDGEEQAEKARRGREAAIGAGIGIIFGAAFGAPGVGMVIGAAIGLAGGFLPR